MKRLICLILVLCLVGGLAACGGSGDDVDEEVTPEETEAAERSSGDYSPSYVDLPVEMDYASDLLARDGRLYLCYGVSDGDDFIYYVAGMDESGGDLLTYEQADHIAGIALDPGGNLWALSSEDGETYALHVYTGEGDLTRTVELPDGVDSELYIGSVDIDGDGRVFLTAFDDSDTTVYVLDESGELEFDLEMSGLPLGAVMTADGVFGVCPYDVAEVAAGSLDFSLYLVDADEGAWMDETVSVGLTQFMYGGLSHSFYVNDTADVFGYDLDTGDKTLLFNWVEVGIVVDLALLAELEDGRIAVLGGKLNQSAMRYEDFTLAILGGEGDGGSTAAADRKVLTLAGLIPNDAVSAAVADFNSAQDEYKIEITTYLSYSDLTSTDDVYEAMTRFNTELLGGNVPDIIDMSSMATDMFAAKGLLEDLYTFIDSDPEMERSDFFENLLEAMSIDGKLAYVTKGVYLFTMTGDTGVVGTGAGITPGELGAILDTHSELSYPLGSMFTSDVFLTNILMCNLDYIDWETGTCHFDSDEFVQLLELAARLPAQASDLEMDTGDVASLLDASGKLADGTQVAALETFLSVDQIASYSRNLGDRVNYIGLPVQEGTGHVIESLLKLGISSTSEHKDAAWAFVRTILENDTQLNSLMLPINRTAFDQHMQNAIDGNSMYATYYGDPEIRQEDVDTLKALMEATTYATSYDQTILNIVEEEAAALFAGEITAAQAADYIQNRVQTYVNEQL